MKFIKDARLNTDECSKINAGIPYEKPLLHSPGGDDQISCEDGLSNFGGCSTGYSNSGSSCMPGVYITP